MQHDHVLKKWIFDALIARVGVSGGKIFAAAFVIPMQHDNVVKKLNLTF